MKTNKAMSNRVKIKDLARELLKIDPAALAVMGAKDGTGGDLVEAGLHEFWRQLLERSLGLLWASDDCKLRLRSDATARALGHHDARLFNLLQLCTIAILREPRRQRGLKDLTLHEADTKVIDLPKEAGKAKSRTSVAELAGIAGMLFEPNFDAIRDAPGPSTNSISIRELMAECLNVAPETLIRPYYDSKLEAADRFAQDPEGQSVAGLGAVLIRSLHHYSTVVSQQIDVISFLYSTGRNYGGPDGPAAANFGSLLTAAALADGKRDLGFLSL